MGIGLGWYLAGYRSLARGIPRGLVSAQVLSQKVSDWVTGVKKKESISVPIGYTY